MVNGEDILLKQQKQHNFDHFIAVLLQQLVIHRVNFNQAIIIQKMLLWISGPFGITYHIK